MSREEPTLRERVTCRCGAWLENGPAYARCSAGCLGLRSRMDRADVRAQAALRLPAASLAFPGGFGRATLYRIEGREGLWRRPGAFSLPTDPRVEARLGDVGLVLELVPATAEEVSAATLRIRPEPARPGPPIGQSDPGAGSGERPA